jgi:transposase
MNDGLRNLWPDAAQDAFRTHQSSGGDGFQQVLRDKSIYGRHASYIVSVRSSPLAGLRSWREDQRMVASESSSGRRVRRWRSVSEKRQIVQLTLEPGASVAEVARAHGVNANQVFKWRREFERGELADTCAAMIPVTVTGLSKSTNDAEQAPPVSSQGAVHIELEGRAVISVESGADPSLVRLILESLRK